MHELGMIRNALNTILDELHQSGGQRVTGVQLAVKASGHTSEESLRQLFGMVAANSPAAGAEVSVAWLPSDFVCLSCVHHFTTCESGDRVVCPHCGGLAMDSAHQDTCFVESIDVVFDDNGVSPAGDRMGSAEQARQQVAGAAAHPDACARV